VGRFFETQCIQYIMRCITSHLTYLLTYYILAQQSLCVALERPMIYKVVCKRNGTTSEYTDNYQGLLYTSWPVCTEYGYSVAYLFTATLSRDDLLLQKFQAVHECHELLQPFLDRNIGEWQRRHENAVQCNGRHIEHVC